MSYANQKMQMEKKSYTAPSMIIRRVEVESVMAGQSQRLGLYLGEDAPTVKDDSQVFSKDLEITDVWEE